MANEQIIVGSLTASIAGDTRYTDKLEVLLSPETGDVTVLVRTSVPQGGMDGDPSPLWLTTQVKASLDHPTPDQVLKAVKAVLADPDYNFKRYGKPTKNFRWHDCNDNVHFGLKRDYVRDSICTLDHSEE